MRLVFDDNAFEDLAWWVKTDLKKAKKIIALLNEVKRNPFAGRGKPEPLKHNLAGCWSRRIDREHRIVYEPSLFSNDYRFRDQIRACAGSIMDNIAEANESLSKKDFVMRIKICRKEAKENRHWLNLLDLNGVAGLEFLRSKLLQEAKELMNISGAILQKTK